MSGERGFQQCCVVQFVKYPAVKIMSSVFSSGWTFLETEYDLSARKTQRAQPNYIQNDQNVTCLSFVFLVLV